MYQVSGKLNVTVTIENPTSAPIISPPFMEFLREMIFSGLLKTLDDLDVPKAVRELINTLSFLDCYIESAMTGKVDLEENGEALRQLPGIIANLESLGCGFDC